MKEKMVEVKRLSDRVMVVKLGTECGMLNVICAYALQMRCSYKEKEEFREVLDKAMQSIHREELVAMKINLNGHIGQYRGGYEKRHGEHGYGQRNKEDKEILQMVQAHDLIIVNTFFQKNNIQKWKC
ncbi:uncharacterized protein LOC106467275 [Limulus polyphemus]|uniref:Uncharacterized protein LOC106467275 n=1 Tax=Limulus polyphemus TaxID=6850 RepID=A0ABM1BJ72_LIMPO|nr:uncharacterized protein LOC106467275 [Limulus polyphemus]